MDEIILQNFKCLDDVRLLIGPLTLLAGLNGMGKSSVLQALLLLRQSGELSRHPGIPSLILNGPWVNVGTARDALYEDADEERISLGIRSGDQELIWSFSYSESEDELRGSQDNPQSLPAELNLFQDNFHYLRAQRFGPRTAFPMSVTSVRSNHQIGPDGEYASFFLSLFGTNDIPCTMLVHKNAASRQLKHQVEAWMGEITPGTRIYTVPHPNLDVVNLEYAFVSPLGETNHFRATNVGFGITYTLPILVALLSSSPGTLVLLENPEAHLHPRGQTMMGRLLALAAAAGVQVLAETHSDHLLNGVRLAVHDSHIAPDDVALHYFGRAPELTKIAARISSPKIDRSGRLSSWPDGFFDESEKVLRKLLGPPSE